MPAFSQDAITKGNRYLAEKAAEECRWVHFFVLSAEQEWISAADRFEMVRRGTADLPNVILHVTSDYLISPVVFPTYFIKDKSAAFTLNCMLDVEIFRSHIAHALGITHRFVGTEPKSAVTAAYNEVLKAELPKRGIEVREIERTASAGGTVSASAVREAIGAGDFGAAREMHPASSAEYLAAKGILK